METNDLLYGIGHDAGNEAEATNKEARIVQLKAQYEKLLRFNKPADACCLALKHEIRRLENEVARPVDPQKKAVFEKHLADLEGFWQQAVNKHGSCSPEAMAAKRHIRERIQEYQKATSSQTLGIKML